MLEQSSLVRLQKEFFIEVEWRGFELHPETPVGGIEVVRLFPGRSIDKMRRSMSRFAAEFGVKMSVPEHLPNTRRALAMSEFARDRGRIDSFRQEASRAYWIEQRDLEDEQDLRVIAGRAGLPEEEALAASLRPVYVDRVLRTREEGMDRMVMGVPTLFMGGMLVVGCQRYETLEKVAERAGARRRQA